MVNFRKLCVAFAAAGLLVGGAAHAKSTRASDMMSFGATHSGSPFSEDRDYGWKNFSHFIKWKNHDHGNSHPYGLLRKIAYLLHHFGNDSPGC